MTITGIEAVHFGEQLIQRLLTLVILLHRIDATSLAHGIQFIDEDNRRNFVLGLLEEITDPRGAHTPAQHAPQAHHRPVWTLLTEDKVRTANPVCTNLHRLNLPLTEGCLECTIG